ncbi:MAG: GntR family transcriptional regulator [Myxococcota bacterium]|nr:GntR family transcriptional regulator [Myxococcota bacterium]
MSQVRTLRAVDLAVDHLRLAILTGQHPPGSFLPPERRLAESLCVNRLTLRSALSRLEAEGLIRPRQGQGIRVLDYRDCGSVELMVHMEPQKYADDLFNLHRTTIAEATALACSHVNDADISQLNALSDAHQLSSSIVDQLEGDSRFYRQLIQLSQSLALRLVYNTVERALDVREERERLMQEQLPQVRAGYRMVIDLLRGGDPDWARETMRHFLEGLLEG